jgi:hypothetical protein
MDPVKRGINMYARRWHKK